jgi:iron complex outermembrane receptor protein
VRWRADQRYRDDQNMNSDVFANRPNVRQAVKYALWGLMAVGVASVPLHGAWAADTTSDDLETVTVTGTLIPIQKQLTVPTPIVTINADDLTSKGFTSIADALSQAVFSTGGNQNGFPDSFTPGAKTISMFGLDPSYTKFLIDGRPMGAYPSLFNGTDLVTSISGIPSELIDHIDILPGGQSSIYGSDAIAGVVNIVMKNNLDGPIADAKYGWDQAGGQRDLRLALADGATFGNLKFIAGVQYENTDPLWGFQRPETSVYNYGGNDPGIAARDWLVFGYFGQPSGTYYFEDPTDCGNVASQFNDSVGERFRPDGHGYYCGSFDAGQYTQQNGESQVQGYTNLSYDVNDHLQLYANVLLNHDVATFSTGTGDFDTSDDTSSFNYAYYEDPNLGDYMNLQHIFSPEEAGGLNNTLSEDIVNGERFVLGGKGTVFSTPLTYDASMTFEQDKLTERVHMQFTTPLDSYYAPIFGPEGYDAVNEAFTYTPNYAAFYNPVSPAAYSAFSGYATSYSYTQSTLARGQLTDPSLFALPGGNAALAFVAEGGDEGWNYTPDPRYATGETYEYTSVGGSGHRSKYAGTMELRLPVLSMLSITASGRYDKFNVTGDDFEKFTYNIGVDFHPISMLSLRARYGTAFKAPSLADEFQGQSGSYAPVTDYYQCAKQGFTGANLSNCPGIYLNDDVFTSTQGNPALKPTTAKVWDAGLVLTPVQHLTISSDIMSWNIDNEVSEANLNQILTEDSACLLGQLDPTSSTCQVATSLVARNGAGIITSISDAKLNQTNETVLTSFTQIQYMLPAGHVGDFTLSAAWTDMLKHTAILYAGDPTINLLNDPFYSTEFKSKVNASLTWTLGQFSTTLFVNRDGSTPNYVSTLTTAGYATLDGGTLSPYTIANFSVQYQLKSGLLLTAAIDNVLNAMPPVDRTYPNYEDIPFNNEQYTVIGRQFSVEATYKFTK